jgi:hypothetical protein
MLGVLSVVLEVPLSVGRGSERAHGLEEVDVDVEAVTPREDRTGSVVADDAEHPLDVEPVVGHRGRPFKRCRFRQPRSPHDWGVSSRPND